LSLSSVSLHVIVAVAILRRPGEVAERLKALPC
jgi:hypothetical protein